MDEPDGPTEPMYVQMARRALFDGTVLTLLDLAPATVFLSERPATTVGHVPTGEFLDRWYDDADGHGTRAVPAVLSVLDADRGPDTDAHVLLSMPRIRDAGLEYRVRVLAGEVAASSGACVLFIRPMVPPDTPRETGSSLPSRPSPPTAA